MRQESHRVYWQQRGAVPAGSESSARDLITSSAAIRISEAARAKDVTQLLRQTLSLPFPLNASEQDNDFLVLIGTLRHFEIKFEHEVQSRLESMHVVRSLTPQDSPLVVRDLMVEYLDQRYPAKSHQMQWFFVPGIEPSGNIPNYVELDGYCTSMEEEDDEDDDSDSEQDEECSDMGDLTETLRDEVPWWRIDSTRMTSRLPLHLTSDKEPPTNHSTETIRLAREQRRLMQLSNCRSALDNHCVSGYLLKRSPHDVHVWKRVHCVLTDDHLWYVSRIQNKIARHGRIGLIRSMLVEHYDRIPFCFELVSASGTSHVFRAPNRNIQARWIACLRERIVQCHDNRLMEHAELIVGDETVARNKRLAQVALPQETLLKCVSNNNHCQKNVMNVARFGMEVASYRESCRHIQAVLPSRTAVVAVSSSSRPPQPPQDLLPSQNGPLPNEIASSRVLLDSDTRDMVRSAWDEAAGLLGVATQLAFALPGGTLGFQDGSKRMARSLETKCRHVDYVITGRFRPIDESGVFSEGLSNTRSDVDPPPADLFDHLLRELQSLAGSIDNKNKVHSNTNGKVNGEAKNH